MTGRATVRRSELALAGLVASVLLVAAVVGLDALRFHLPLLATGSHPAPDLHAAGLLLLLAIEAAFALRALRSIRRQLRVERRLRMLPVGERLVVAGCAVRVVADARPLAFCAGMLRPAVYVTDTALARLTAGELAAVIGHEAHHARRRDPLRLLVARTLADATGLVRGLPGHQMTAADLSADAAAVAATGSAAPLASAMLRLQDPAPERVDQLLGRPLDAGSRLPLAAALLAAAGLFVLAVSIALAPADPALAAPAALALAAPWLLAVRA